MPEHIRTSVRKAFAAILANGLAGVEIHPMRPRPLGLKSPGQAVEIFITQDPVTTQGNHCGNGEYLHSMTVQVVGYHVSANPSEENSEASDLLALDIEKLMHAPGALAGLVTDHWLEGTDLALDAGSYSNASFMQRWRVELVSSLADQLA